VDALDEDTLIAYARDHGARLSYLAACGTETVRRTLSHL
jgi:hypothetical protein